MYSSSSRPFLLLYSSTAQSFNSDQPSSIIRTSTHTQPIKSRDNCLRPSEIYRLPSSDVMADSLYKDDVYEILALARLAQRHAEYESDEELDVFGGDRIDVEPPVTMAPHGTRSGPGDWVSEDLDLVAPEFQEAPEKKHKREGWKRKQGDETKQPEAKNVKRDTKRKTKTDATAEATTGVPGEQASRQPPPTQTLPRSIPAAPEPPPRRGQLVDIKGVPTWSYASRSSAYDCRSRITGSSASTQAGDISPASTCTSRATTTSTASPNILSP
jgi:hypothetical protein